MQKRATHSSRVAVPAFCLRSYSYVATVGSPGRRKIMSHFCVATDFLDPLSPQSRRLLLRSYTMQATQLPMRFDFTSRRSQPFGRASVRHFYRYVRRRTCDPVCLPLWC